LTNKYFINNIYFDTKIKQKLNRAILDVKKYDVYAKH